ncbi:zinc finger protein zfp-1-like [Actinia tenebrosa]|uniref:Zinc finger protein zfp-1-like n=1 Tax=Actinia tenebrosa TaxID=6105 RepID=A0A6P8HW79_ACTTE|nr:zinc finger protein zfp-1-like [Actinia tenebrosa]
MVKAMVGGCCVCSDERGWDENPLVYCDGHGCNVAVHQACYGIVQVPKGPWFCRKCESQERIARVKCELCPSKTGALKRTDTGGWAHVVCALYIPEVRFGNVTTMEPIILASVPHDRYLKMCYICEERGKESKTAHGGCMNCNKQGCKQTFHVTCAQSRGFLCEENDGQSGHTVKYVGYCQFHWNKRNKGLLNIKTPEKEKLKLKWEKEKKPKPRTSSESQPSGSQPQKPDSTPKSSPISSSSTCMPSTAPVPSSPGAPLPGTPKQRGRKPSTVKTLPGNASGSGTSSSVNEIQAEISQEQERPGVVLSSPTVSTAASPVPSTAVANLINNLTISSSSTTTGITESIFAPIPTTAPKNGGQISSKNNLPVTSNSIAQPTPTPPPVSAPIPKTVTQPKPAVIKKSVNQTKNTQGPRKRASSKTEDEPKRKVGRPPLKNKGAESKSKLSRPASTPKLSRPASTPRQSKSKSQNKSQEAKRPVITSPTPVNLSSSYPGYPMSSMAEMSSSSLVSVSSGMPPASSHGVTPYVIPQPHLAGQLENGYSTQESNRQTTNGPLQLPNSLEQLLEYQWEQGAQFLMQQASQYDVASLMSSLHQLKADNTRLESRLESLMSRRSQLLQVSSRLAAPMSCTPTNTSTTNTDTSNKEPTGTRTTFSVTQSIPTATSTRTSAVSTSGGSTSVSVSIEKSSPSVSKPEPIKAAPKSQTPPSSTNSISENKPTSAKTKNDKSKSPPIKVTMTPQNMSGTLLTVPITSKMVAQKSVNLQPSQIKVSMVKPRVTQGVADKDKLKIVSTAPPIAILPTLTSPLVQKQQLQLLQPQTKQMTQNKTSKQPHILPHQTLTSQAFAAQQFPQQQQFVLLMQQQQHLQQHLQRQAQGAYQSGQNQLVSSQAQSSKGTASQKFVPTPMSLGYQGGFVTISDGLGIAGQPIDVSKGFATLPLVQLEKNKANDHSDKNGTTSTSDKSLLKNS